MKKLLVNASNLHVAGGLTVGLNFVKNIIANHSDLNVVLLAPPNCGYEIFESDKLTIEFVPHYLSKFFLRFALECFWIKKIIKKEKPDVIFSMGNFAVITDIKQGLLIMNPFIIYNKQKEVWKLLSNFEYLYELLVRFYFRIRIKYADIVFAQTQVSQKHLEKNYSNIHNVTVIPTAFSNIGLEKNNQINKIFFNREADLIYLLCLSKYYVHKNIEIFLPVAQYIKTNKLPFRILITIEKTTKNKKIKALLNAINDKGLDNIIINIGFVRMNDVPCLYNQVDGMILPTLFESYSATYADSLHFKKPIFTSDRDFARSVCGNCAFYFNPHSPKSVISCITAAYKDSNLISQKVKAGFQRSNRNPDWDEVTDMYLYALEKLVCEEVDELQNIEKECHVSTIIHSRAQQALESLYVNN